MSRLGVLGALTLVLASCTPDVPRAEVDIRSQPEALALYAPFLSDSTVTAEEEAALVNAQALLLEECMAEKGFDYDGGWIAPSEINRQGTTGFFAGWLSPTPEQADRDGFGFTNAAASGPADSQELARPPENRSTWSEQKSDALFGDPAKEVTLELANGDRIGYSTDSCYAYAYERLAGSVQEFEEIRILRNSFRPLFWDALPEAPEVEDGLDRWSACMSESGSGEFSEPGDVLRMAADLVSAGHGFEAERSLAVAHADCLVESGLADAVATNSIPILEDLAKGRADDLVALKEGIDSVLSAAEEVLESR